MVLKIKILKTEIKEETEAKSSKEWDSSLGWFLSNHFVRMILSWNLTQNYAIEGEIIILALVMFERCISFNRILKLKLWIVNSRSWVFSFLFISSPHFGL